MAQLSSPEHFHTVLDFAFGIADRGVPLSLVLIEPDGWSESELDPEERAAVERLAADIAMRTRRSDRITRLTLTRFAALLVDCNRQGAMIFADRILVAAEPFGLGIGATVSCGIATVGEGMKSAYDLVAAAATALDRACEAGGGRVEVHGAGA
jgi:hypothetical protein